MVCAEVDPMRFYGIEAVHCPYPEVRRTPPEKAHLGPWEARVDDGVDGHFVQPEEAADKSDEYMTASGAARSHMLLGVPNVGVADLPS